MGIRTNVSTYVRTNPNGHGIQVVPGHSRSHR
jgi:hypothetical protein